MSVKTFLASVVLFALAACGGGPQFVGRSDMKVVSAAELPPPGREDLILQQRSYLVGPFDRVAIDVYGMPELTRTVQVDASGRISLPLVGDIDAAGRTPGEIADLITERLDGRYVRDPQVIVNADTVNQMITVTGEVDEPGQFPVTGRMTLMRSIALAKGVTELASTNHVVVFRQVNNQDMAALYDLRGIRRGMYPDPEVYANDVVYVGESESRRLFQSAVSASTILAAPLITLLQRL